MCRKVYTRSARGGGNLELIPQRFRVGVFKKLVSGQAARLGFTLAEVLITLGIIGVVAALTLPALIQNYQKNVAAEQLKKIYSTLKNAEARAINDYGESVYWDYSDPDVFVNTYYVPYLNVVKMNPRTLDYKVRNLNGEDLGTWLHLQNSPNGGRNIFLADGAIIKYWNNSQFFLFQVDANGAKGPNVFGKDIWDFELYYDGYRKLVPKGNLINKYPNQYDTYYNWCKTYKPASGSGCPCSGLLIYNNYKINEKYPW